jgi:hypothetical protein
MQAVAANNALVHKVAAAKFGINGTGSIGIAVAFQAGCREFESRLPLHSSDLLSIRDLTFLGMGGLPASEDAQHVPVRFLLYAASAWRGRQAALGVV